MLKIITIDSPEAKILRTPCQNIIEMDKAFIEMLDFIHWKILRMNQKKAKGIAAPQVGYSHTAFITARTTKGIADIVMNPYWKPADKSNLVEYEERCLSIPGKIFIVDRWDKIAVHYHDYKKNKKWAGELTGESAFVYQHECDHLNGVLLDTVGKAKT